MWPTNVRNRPATITSVTGRQKTVHPLPRSGCNGCHLSWATAQIQQLSTEINSAKLYLGSESAVYAKFDLTLGSINRATISCIRTKARILNIEVFFQDAIDANPSLNYNGLGICHPLESKKDLLPTSPLRFHDYDWITAVGLPIPPVRSPFNWGRGWCACALFSGTFVW